MPSQISTMVCKTNLVVQNKNITRPVRLNDATYIKKKITCHFCQLFWRTATEHAPVKQKEQTPKRKQCEMSIQVVY